MGKKLEEMYYKTDTHYLFVIKNFFLWVTNKA